MADEPRRAGEGDCCDGIPTIMKETLYIGREHGAEGIEDFMTFQVLNMAEELGITFEEADDLHNLMETERAQLDPVRQAKVKCLPGHGGAVGARFV